MSLGAPSHPVVSPLPALFIDPLLTSLTLGCAWGLCGRSPLPVVLGTPTATSATVCGCLGSPHGSRIHWGGPGDILALFPWGWGARSTAGSWDKPRGPLRCPARGQASPGPALDPAVPGEVPVCPLEPPRRRSGLEGPDPLAGPQPSAHQYFPCPAVGHGWSIPAPVTPAPHGRTRDADTPVLGPGLVPGC